MANDTPQLTDPNMIKEANRFALLLVQNKDLLMAWYDTLTKALQHKQYEVQVMDNFIAQKSQNGVDDFDTTYGYVIQAQQKLAAYQIYYWSGLYKTTKKAASGSDASSEGDPISIVGSGSQSTAPFVSIGKSEIIEYQFKNLVLSWDGASGLNPTTGNLILGVRNISGVATKTFAGTITEGGVQYSYAGVMVDPKSATGQQQVSKTPPQTSSSLQKLEYANQIINMVSQALFMAVNIGMLYKTGKEISELRSRLNKQPNDEELKNKLKSAEDRQEVNEKAADQATENSDSVRDPVESMSDEDFSIGSQDASPATEASDLPDIEPPSELDDLELSEQQAEVADEAIESEIEQAGDEPNSLEDGEDSGLADDAGSMEDGEDVLTSGLEDFGEFAV